MKAKAPRGIGTSLASSTWTRFGTTTHCLKRTNGGVALARKQLLEQYEQQQQVRHVGGRLGLSSGLGVGVGLGGRQPRQKKACLVIVRANEDDDAEELYDYATEKVRSLLKRDAKELKGIEEIGESAEAFQPSTSDDASSENEVSSRPASGAKGSVQSPFASSGGAGKSVQSPFAASGGAGKSVQSPFASSGGSGKSVQSPFAASGSVGGASSKSSVKSPFGSGSSGKSSGSSSASTNSPRSVSSLSQQKLMSPFKADAQSVDVQSTFEGEEERPWWQPQITLTQIVLAFSFSLLVLLMLGTCFIVVKMGAISLNDK